MSKKKKESIIKEWGKPKNRSYRFELIEQYAIYKNRNNSSILNDKAFTDLDFYDFFKFVDRTYSSVGQQFLFNKFIANSDTTEDLESQEKLVNYYNSNQDKRLNSQIVLSKLSKTNDYYFPYLVFAELPKKMYSNWLIIGLQLLLIISILLSLKFPFFLIAIAILFVVNLGLHYLHKSRIGRFTVYFSRLTSLSITLRKILPFSCLDELRKVKLLTDINCIEKITSQVLFLKTDELQQSEIGSFFWFFFELLKIVTLSEIIVFNKLVSSIHSSRNQIENVFIAIGEIDTAISICSLRAGLHYFSIPTFISKSKSLELKELYHPLIADCIPNDIKLHNKSLLLTGSNMAGKSTFIKAVNLNVLSSQVLNTSFSKFYSAPTWKLVTSMTIKDDLNNSSSYYMEEVNSIGDLIKCSEEKDKLYLFTIDEIFKGTNTIERISTAKAILEYINRNDHMVLVSTHDIELTNLLHNGFELYYFQESITNETLAFDYKLKKGILEQSNAIKILELIGYPKTITDEAKALALKIAIEKTRTGT